MADPRPQPDWLARQEWQERQAWTVLDLEFGRAQRFFQLWSDWRSSPDRPRMLHYAGLLSEAEASELAANLTHTAIQSTDALREFRQSLAAAGSALKAGFHRLLLEGGRLSLTLCVGDAKHSLLSELHMQADAVFTGDCALHWDRWNLKALLRQCRRGAHIRFSQHLPPTAAALAEAGLQIQQHNARELRALYAPAWPLKVRATSARLAGRAPARCSVVGAGLAGASVASALALRGWQVSVHEAGTGAAAGASGLPAGLLSPHVSADDSPRSRLSRCGVSLMRQHARRLLIEQLDWSPTGGLELDIPPGSSLPVASHWHAQAAWIRPARLVEAWLRQDGIELRTQSNVAALRREGDQWQLLDAQGKVLEQTDVVILANAHACQHLLAPHSDGLNSHARSRLDNLQVLLGTLSCGLHTPALDRVLPPYPVNGNGSLISAVPSAQGLRWYAGSTFETESHIHADLSAQHQSNLDKLQTLLPEVAAVLEPQFSQGQVSHWQGERCVSHDRMPLAGPLENGTAPSLWISAAMGARGLSFAALCAELLVAQLCDEPWPVPASLAAKLLATRPARRPSDSDT
jgi:tRNA 5-methylaminomethyl-2-thiouridine biosynthesis bifunctional protein